MRRLIFAFCMGLAVACSPHVPPDPGQNLPLGGTLMYASPTGTTRFVEIGSCVYEEGYAGNGKWVLKYHHSAFGSDVPNVVCSGRVEGGPE